MLVEHGNPSTEWPSSCRRLVQPVWPSGPSRPRAMDEDQAPALPNVWESRLFAPMDMG